MSNGIPKAQNIISSISAESTLIIVESILIQMHSLLAAFMHGCSSRNAAAARDRREERNSRGGLKVEVFGAQNASTPDSLARLA